MPSIKLVSANKSSYFQNNKIEAGTTVPSTGDYKKGDIIINIGTNSSQIPMWLCTNSGNPGTWEIIGETYTIATTVTNGLMSSADKTKLNGIATGANNYVHPGSGTNPHGTTKADIGLGNVNNWGATTAVNSTSTTTYATASAVKQAYDLAASKASTSVATTSANGLMSSTDKTKLNGIATGANNYVHPGSGTNPHGTTKTDVGLGSVNNWGASSATNNSSTSTYATTAGVKAAYDLANTKVSKTDIKGVTNSGSNVHKRLDTSVDKYYSATSETVDNLKLEIGTVVSDFSSDYIPKIRLGASGMDPDTTTKESGNYVFMAHHPKTNNPISSAYDVFSIVHRNRNTENWHGFRTLGNGEVQIFSADGNISLTPKSEVVCNRTINTDTIATRALKSNNSGAILMHSSLDGNGKNLGWSGSKFNQVVATNGYFEYATGASDRNKKKDIIYVSDENIDNYNNDNNISEKDLFDFVNNELKLAEFTYITDRDELPEDRHIGFIAQDIADTKIGKKFIYNSENGLIYSYIGFISILAGALKEEIRRREELEALVLEKINS